MSFAIDSGSSFMEKKLEPESTALSIVDPTIYLFGSGFEIEV